MDGAGTTTQARTLVEGLIERGREALYTREPSDGPVGTFIRAVLRGQVDYDVSETTLAALFAADRRVHLDSEIEPALLAGRDVVSDRYVLSSLAYQGVTTGDLEWVRAINAGVRRPDVSLLLDVPPEEAARRRGGRDGPPERYEVDETQRAVQAAYLALAEEWAARLVNGMRDKAVVASEILALVEEAGR